MTGDERAAVKTLQEEIDRKRARADCPYVRLPLVILSKGLARIAEAEQQDRNAAREHSTHDATTTKMPGQDGSTRATYRWTLKRDRRDSRDQARVPQARLRRNARDRPPAGPQQRRGAVPALQTHVVNT